MAVAYIVAGNPSKYFNFSHWDTIKTLKLQTNQNVSQHDLIYLRWKTESPEIWTTELQKYAELTHSPLSVHHPLLQCIFVVK